MIVLITGGMGFIGSEIVKQLQNYENIEIRVIDDMSYGGCKNYLDTLKCKYILFKGSILDKNIVETAMINVDYVFHLAALISVADSFRIPEEYENININGTKILLEEASKANVKSFVFSSSSAVYGDTIPVNKTEDTETLPLSPYALSKYLAEKECEKYNQNSNMKISCLRYFNVFGENQDPNRPYAACIPQFKQQIDNNQELTIFGNGKQTRSFIHVFDVAKANIHSAFNKLEGIYNIGYPDEISINELSKKILKITKKYDYKIKYTNSRPGDVQKISCNPQKFLDTQFKFTYNINTGLYNVLTPTILVTGCAGFIGFHTCIKLLKQNYKIIGIDTINDYYSTKTKQNNINDLLKFNNFTFIQNNFSNINGLNIKAVIHLAAYAGVRKSLETPEIYIKNNIEETCKLLDNCKKNNINLVLFASSSSVYGLNQTPFNESDTINSFNSIYAWTKKSMEDLCALYTRLYNINCIGMRFFTVYGPRGRPDMAPYKFLNKIINNQKIQQYGNGNSIRDYTYIDDIVDGIYKLFQHYSNKNINNTFEIFNLGNNHTISLNDFIKTCENVCNKKANIEIIHNQKGDVPKTHANINKAINIVKYNPQTNLKDGLKKTYEWLTKKNENNTN